jgi:RNase H-fold protein (predicted Holliday junction resolvase)
MRWAEEVADILNLPVRFIDERYSSARATDRVGRQGGGAGGGEPGPRRRAAYRASIDQAAAVLILEDEADPGLHLDPSLMRAEGVE